MPRPPFEIMPVICPHCLADKGMLVKRCNLETCDNIGCQALMHEQDWTYNQNENRLFHRQRQCGRPNQGDRPFCWQHQDAWDRYRKNSNP